MIFPRRSAATRSGTDAAFWQITGPEPEPARVLSVADVDDAMRAEAALSGESLPKNAALREESWRA
jgi:hypothetical protein